MISVDTTIIVDADALIAVLDSNDIHHNQALHVVRSLGQVEAPLLYPSTTVAEAAMTLQRKFNKPELVARIVEMVTNNELLVEPVDEGVISAAATFFRPHGSKHNTLFDAIVAALAHKHQTKAIFSFDSWYEKLGLQLVDRML